MSEPIFPFRRDRLVFVNELSALGLDPRDLRRAHARGSVVRVRRGVYMSREQWDAASPSERHVMVVRAVVRVAHSPFLVAGRSAAAMWGMPYAAEWPDDVTLLTPYRGGGTSEIGVRRTSAAASGATVTATTLKGVPVTGMARTALDVARGLPLPAAVAVLDWAQWRKNRLAVSRDELDTEWRRAHYARGGAFLRHTLDLSTELSGSPGESKARVAVHLLGFEAPELQVRFVDAEGEMFPDFFWRGVAVAGEFDGKAKYSREEYSGGDPTEVLWKEKKREDRLRRQVRGIVRILSEHVAQPRRLEALLTEAGIPRRPRERPSSDAREPCPQGSAAP
ncbi:MAG: type IV toxin-antitoxin system AbiEi family antitoxin domain-containing protein [Pseudolysinimonas sp.]